MHHKCLETGPVPKLRNQNFNHLWTAPYLNLEHSIFIYPNGQFQISLV